MFAEHWNGEEWVLEEPPVPAEDTDSDLGGVSCIAADWCLAVGNAGIPPGISHGAAEWWNGKEWAFQEVATPDEDGSLGSVSCVSSESCTAVGSYSDERALTLAEHWNGAAWAIQETPNPEKATDSYLESVACFAEGSCIAAGQNELPFGGGRYSLLTEQYF